jgi:hypothetical protein
MMRNGSSAAAAALDTAVNKRIKIMVWFFIVFLPEFGLLLKSA